MKLDMRFWIVVVVFSLGLSLGGCSYKNYRTKPTTFISTQKVHTSTELEYRCIDSYEHIEQYDNSLNSYACKNYATVSIQNVLQVGKDKKKETAQELLYIADSNCNRFINKFQANYMLSDKANKLLELNILGVGVNIGEVQKISYQEFESLKKNLRNNMKKRASIKQDIENHLSNSKINNYSIEEILVDIIEYDRSCSLFEDLTENNSTKVVKKPSPKK